MYNVGLTLSHDEIVKKIFYTKCRPSQGGWAYYKHLIKRFILMLTGWIAATMTAACSALLVMFSPEMITVIIHYDGTIHFEELYSSIFMIIFMFIAATYVVIITIFVPSIVIIFWAELTKQRNRFFYCLSGAAIGTGYTIDHLYLSSRLHLLNAVHFIIAGIASGFLAGLVYWRIAGRAGS